MQLNSNPMKTMVITGGTRGIGKSIVQQFLKNGYKVFTCGSKNESAEKLKQDCNKWGNDFLQVEVVDMASKEQIKNWANRILSSVSTIDVLINNVGMFYPEKISEEEDGVFENTIQTNLASAYHTTRAFIHHIKNQGFGDIFTICSIASITAYTNGGSYCISKFGLLGFNKVLREEMKPFGVRVISVLPGATETDSWSGVVLPPNRLIPPQDIADMIWAIHQLKGHTVVEEILIRPQLGDV